MNIITKYLDFITEGKVKKDERIVILRDERYIIVAPLTEEASCKYGAFTGWCTAAPGSGAFNTIKNINEEGNPKLVYIIQVGYEMSDENEEQSEEYKDLLDKLENEEFDEEQQERFYDISKDVNSLDFTKIAVEFSTNTQSYNLWSANNINIADDPWYYDLYDLPIDEYALDLIDNFCKER